jgi:hypothetical protein
MKAIYMNISILSPVSDSDDASTENGCIWNTTYRLICTSHMEFSLVLCEKSESCLKLVDKRTQPAALAAET